MNFKSEFESVDLILDSKCITKGVDAFALSLIKAERQMRKLFTFLVYQNPNLEHQYNALREALSENKNVYFLGFINGIESMYPVKIKDLVGQEYDTLEKHILNTISIRNKIFHGQITNKSLSTEELRLTVDNIKKWCSHLADSAIIEFGYDGFGRNSMQKSKKEIYSKYLVRLESIDDYKRYIKRYMTGERKEKLTKQDIDKSNQGFYRISKPEMLKGVLLCLENAKSQLNTAIRTQNDNIGLSNSLMILSVEESIKGMVLLAPYFNVPVPFLIKSIFAHHQAKHVRGKEVNDFVRTFSLILETISSKGSSKAKAILALALEALGNGSTEINWWEKANDAKNYGLYVGYSGNHFESPLTFNKEYFKTSQEIASRFVSILDKGADLLTKQIQSDI